MKENTVAEKSMGRRYIHSKPLDRYYSVEFSIDGLLVVYQFKIWDTGSTDMYILIKENSAFLPWIKIGDNLNLKYYSRDLTHPYENLDTEIRSIAKQEQGRLKGHYLVGFEILDNRDQNKIDWYSLSNKAQVLPFNAAALRNTHID